MTLLAPSPSFPRGVRTEELRSGAVIVRIHRLDNDAIWFGPAPAKPPAGRFDAPAGQYRIMYAAAVVDGAFVETILHNRTQTQIVAKSYLDLRAWTEIAVLRPLVLMKLHGDGLFRHGTDATISAARDYGESRRLALAAYLEHPQLDGLAYRARHDNDELCYALFDRVGVADLRAAASHRFSERKGECSRLMDRYGAVFDMSPPVPTRQDI